MKAFRTIMAAVCACLFCLTSCQEPDPEPINVSWAPASALSGPVSFTLGQSQSISMTAENIDYVELSSKPDGWDVKATVNKVDITAPDGLTPGFAMTGDIELLAVNRSENKEVQQKISVTIDQASIKGKIEMKTDVKYATVFNVGETKEFEFATSFVNDVTASAAAGWTATVDMAAKKVAVTAPSSFAGKVAVTGDVVLSAKSITGADAEGATFQVALPAYKVAAADILDDADIYGVYDDEGKALGLVARQGKEVNLYVVTEKDGAKAYSEAIALTGDVVFANNGSQISEFEGEPMAASVSPYTVKDADENVYQTTWARGAIWMASNFKCTKAPDGTELTGFKAPNNVDSNIAEYGLLYDKTIAFNGAEPAEGHFQGICPAGWHIPAPAEFSDINFPEELADDNPDEILFKTLTSKPAGFFMTIPMMGIERPLMFGQFSNVQTSDPSYVAAMAAVPVIPGMEDLDVPKSIEFQMYPAYFVSLRCVKDVMPFTE